MELGIGEGTDHPCPFLRLGFYDLEELGVLVVRGLHVSSIPNNIFRGQFQHLSLLIRREVIVFETIILRGKRYSVHPMALLRT